MIREDPYKLRSGIIIMPEHSQQIEEQLNHLMQHVPAQFILLVDVTGQVVGAKGLLEATNLVMLGSLVAGDLAASQEIARLMGEYQDYHIVLREGQKSHIFIAEGGPYLALLVKVGVDVPLGWARMLIRQTAEKLATIFQGSAASAATMEQVAPVAKLLDDDFDTSLSDLFDDALDDMWLEQDHAH